METEVKTLADFIKMTPQEREDLAEQSDQARFDYYNMIFFDLFVDDDTKFKKARDVTAGEKASNVLLIERKWMIRMEKEPNGQQEEKNEEPQPEPEKPEGEGSGEAA